MENIANSSAMVFFRPTHSIINTVTIKPAKYFLNVEFKKFRIIGKTLHLEKVIKALKTTYKSYSVIQMLRCSLVIL